jgi:hypothetical protein
VAPAAVRLTLFMDKLLAHRLLFLLLVLISVRQPPEGTFRPRDEFARLVRAAGARLLSRAPARDGSTGSKNSAAMPICLHDEETCCWGETPKCLQHVQIACVSLSGAELIAVDTAGYCCICAGKGRQPKHVWHVSSKWLSDTASAYTVAPLEDYVVDSNT